MQRFCLLRVDPARQEKKKMGKMNRGLGKGAALAKLQYTVSITVVLTCPIDSRTLLCVSNALWPV